MLLDRSTLPVQGPPGSGKTHSGARMALDLVRAGKRVGVTANSHKVIAHFLGKLLEAAEQGACGSASSRSPARTTPPSDTTPWRRRIPTSRSATLRSGAANVAAGTTWLWARQDMVGTVDVLFVDEAGQMSLANVLAAGGQCLVARPAR